MTRFVKNFAITGIAALLLLGIAVIVQAPAGERHAGQAAIIGAEKITYRGMGSQPIRTSGRDEPAEIIFSEDFEEGAEGWTTHDLTNPDTVWHKSDFMARGQGDLLWWCGDTITGLENPYYGYDNIWLQYLDTPVLDLSQAAEGLTLTFDAYWLLEDPRRVQPPQPYDGWDGWLVLASTNDGQSFSIIRPETPAYTANRISAAERFWMLQGEWPGWVFESGEWDAANDDTPEPDWVQVRFNLNNFRRANVVVRFMLCSDRAVAAPWNAYLANSGVFVDNIVIRDGNRVFLSNNGTDDPVPSELIARRGPGFGDFWRRTNADAHSGNWSMWNDDNNFNIINAVDSPPFEVPEDFNTHFEFWVHCDLPDAVHAGTNRLVDWYLIYASADGGETWTYITRDYNRPVAGGNGWVLYEPGVPEVGDLNLDLTGYAGREVQLRWEMRTDADHQEGNGSGLFIDDVTVIATNQLPRDVGIKHLHIPYPTTVGYRLSGTDVFVMNYGTLDQASILSWWGWMNNFYTGRYPMTNIPNVPSNDSVRYVLHDGGRPGRGWTPTMPGVFTIYAATNLGGGTEGNPDDDDQNRTNDTCSIAGARVWPAGLYEFGYDSRTYRLAYNYNAGTGPMARYTPAAAGLAEFSLAAAHFRFNGVQNVTARFNLHIYGGSGDTTAPGRELLSLPVDVPVDSLIPNHTIVHLDNYAELDSLQGDVWIWCEILREDRWPQIIGDDQLYGAGRYFRYNGQTATPVNDDLQMHLLVVPSSAVEPRVSPSATLVNFNDVILGQFASKWFSIYNSGRTPLIIRNVSATNDAFIIDWAGAETLRTGKDVTFEINFAPRANQLYAANMVIDCNAPNVPAITLVGSGIISAAPGDSPAAPLVFGLKEPFPNPFNSETRLAYVLDRPGLTTLALFDLTGRQAALIEQEWRDTGRYSTTFKADDLPAGVYLLKLSSGGQANIKKLALVK
ncbi:MAG: T9SS type A sorting domain-containing protein [Calditrichaeota bacterium]|nr:T9SS type A sorting domain-containing protein [Calditrichota bacterium]